jgi:4-amino-4-deoxy-L-arabinose transferase-like glycosyltransferase
VIRRVGLPLEAAVLGIVLAAEGLLFARNLHTATNYDEGVYLASLYALRHGETLGSEVFASQPPGFYLLLRLIGFFSGHSVSDARIGFLLVALVGCAGAYAVGRAIAGVAGGVAASLLLAILPPFPSEAIRVDADVPAVSLAVVALGLAAYAFRGRAPLVLAALGGGVFAFAVSVKLDALIALIPFAGLAVAQRAPRRAVLAAVGGAAIVGAAFLIGYAGVLGPLWDGVVRFHREARAYPSPTANSHVLRHFLQFGTPSGWLVVLGLVASLLIWRKAWPLWLWVVASAGFLLWQKPLFDHHLVLLCAAMALPAGAAFGEAVTRLPGRVSLAGAAAVVVGLAVGGAQQAHHIDLRVVAQRAALPWAEQRLAACPAGPIVSDEPIVAFRARRLLPAQLVDTSLVRSSTSSLPPAKVLAIIDRDRIRVVFADRAFLQEPLILSSLRQRFGAPTRFGAAQLYTAPGACG